MLPAFAPPHTQAACVHRHMDWCRCGRQAKAPPSHGPRTHTLVACGDAPTPAPCAPHSHMGRCAAMRHFKRRAAQHHRWRPYRVEYTGSLLTSEVKRHRAWLVLGWGTAREHLQVLSAFASLAAVGLFPASRPYALDVALGPAGRSPHDRPRRPPFAVRGFSSRAGLFGPQLR